MALFLFEYSNFCEYIFPFLKANVCYNKNEKKRLVNFNFISLNLNAVIEKGGAEYGNQKKTEKCIWRGFYLL